MPVAGTIVAVPRITADTIIPEYGIAKLKGLT
jgi:acyl-CoA hydrolase